VAAALPPSGTVWTDRGLRTVLRRLLRRRRTVAPLADPEGEAPPLGEAPVAGPPATLGGAALTLPSAEAAAAAEPAGPPRAAPAANCPSCHVPYLPSGVAGRRSCPLCGRHAMTEGARARSGASTGPAGAAANPREELLASWMIGRTVPCPHCRSPLRQFSSTVLICHACGRRLEVPELDGGRSRGRAAAETAVPDHLDRPVHVGGDRPVRAEGRDAGP
jgi:uncharacterized Zn finger protein (UPF0148 family)